ncbi:MAG: NAD(P)-dependent alcohol dehydrogenase [Saprospiraceae bacterium]
MKAVIYQQYGKPEVLVSKEINNPVANENQVLVRIHHTSVTIGDTLVRKGSPFPIRFMSGLFKPKNPVLGHEFSGVVESVGTKVTEFKTGDRVFGSTGTGSGTYAEYFVMDENAHIAKLPDNISLSEASTIPVGALTALYFLQKGKIVEGQEILIHGASGSVGTAAVQLAKAFGATVTAVCSGSKAKMVSEIGADQVIDYKKEDFLKTDKKYDLIFNVSGKTSFKDCKAVMQADAMYVAANAAGSDYGKIFFGKKSEKKRIVAGVMKGSKENLKIIASIIAKGQFKSVIDKTFPMEQLAEAHAYVEKGDKAGNVAINII